MKKKLVATVIAAALVASVGIGSTLAYLHDATENATVNTFTIGDVKIDLDEPSWDPDQGNDMLPGATVNKNPIVTNVGQTEAFIGIRVDGIQELAAQGFLVRSGDAELDAKYEIDETTGELKLENGLAILKDESKMFAWNPSYKLVDKEGKVVAAGSDDVLTYGEMKALTGDTLYFAYESEVAAGAQTKPLFDTVTLDTDVLGSISDYTIVKHFVNAAGEVMNPDANGLYATEPKKNDNGEYIYKFSIKDQNGYYDTYQGAKDKVDALEAADTTAKYEVNMKIKAAAIQSVNGSNEANWKVANTETWYKELPAKFFE